MRTAALIAVAAILVLSLGGLAYSNDMGCCGKAASIEAGPCLGLCVPVAKASTATVGIFLLGWFFPVPIRQYMPLLTHPIKKPPA